MNSKMWVEEAMMKEELWTRCCSTSGLHLFYQHLDASKKGPPEVLNDQFNGVSCIQLSIPLKMDLGRTYRELVTDVSFTVMISPNACRK